MKQLKFIDFSVAIHAPANRVWWAMWNDAHYKQWGTSAVIETVFPMPEWRRGRGASFLNESGDGVFSRITEIEKNERITFTHEYELKNHRDIPLDDLSIEWSHRTSDQYVLTEEAGTTIVDLKMRIEPENEEHFKEVVPKALATLKSVAENFIMICEVNMIGRLPQVWEYWTAPSHIVCWNFARDSWHSPRAVNDLSVGGKFNYRMEAKDGSRGFDFEGIYISVIPQNYIEYALADGRKVKISFSVKDYNVRIVLTFEPENEKRLEEQQERWQAIMDNFKKYYRGRS